MSQLFGRGTTRIAGNIGSNHIGYPMGGSELPGSRKRYPSVAATQVSGETALNGVELEIVAPEQTSVVEATDVMLSAEQQDVA